MNKILLHLEGFAVLVLSLYFYFINDYSWLLFFLLLFTPDLSALGYVISIKVGAVLYNFFHTYIIAVAIILLGVLLTNQSLLAIGLILSSHIGMDRMLGYGLKYPTNFKDTHLNRV
ncbi:DUF4260 domain-containing protein [Fredinandcohnia sp. 179-A 10B2 NHS]|uniref:DUF4260 domain-containing protein n=1 Tax=Fredinandcohnia sp. 179-A 10B2 NHS TaxID=3235176 RepID=UPI0039A11B2B